MEDPRLESVRRLMESALREAANFEGGAGLAAELEMQKPLHAEKMELAQAARERERAALKAAMQALQLWLRQAEERTRAEAKALDVQRRELELAQAAWEEEKRAQEDKVLQSRMELETREKTLRQAIPGLEARIAALQEQLTKSRENEIRIQGERENDHAAHEKRLMALEAELSNTRAQADRETGALRAKVAMEQARLEALQEQSKQDQEKMARDFKESLVSAKTAPPNWAQERLELLRRLQELEHSAASPAPPGAPATAPAEPLPYDDKPLPSLEPILDPAWSRIVSLLKVPLANSSSQLRRLAAAKLPDSQRALLRMAAGDLVQVADHIKVIEEFFEGAAAPAPGRLEVAATAALLSWDVAMRARRISLVRQFQGNAPAQFNPENLRVALYQVIRNAYESMPQGGCLTARLSVEPTGPVLTFSDTGTGFSAEALAGLFNPFFSLKKGHLGLGLALTRKILQSWGGGVEAGNNPSGGALVTLRFAGADDGGMPSLTEP